MPKPAKHIAMNANANSSTGLWWWRAHLTAAARWRGW
jgi:hypothetical protein